VIDSDDVRESAKLGSTIHKKKFPLLKLNIVHE
jgi:hypothetical protein